MQNNQDRGDTASILSKRDSVVKFSIRQEWRSAPWLVQDPDMSNVENTESLHFGTLLDGAEMAWRADVQKKEQMVQLAVATPIRNSKLYSSNLTRDAAKFLVRWGNIKNDDSTVISVLTVLWINTFATHLTGFGGRGPGLRPLRLCSVAQMSVVSLFNRYRCLSLWPNFARTLLSNG